LCVLVELIDYTSMTRNIRSAHKDAASKMLSVYMITLSAFCVVFMVRLALRPNSV
jgi:hypothetical protein